MNDEDRVLLQLAALEGKVDSDLLTNEDITQLELMLMDAIFNRKEREGKACVEPTSCLQ